ncbi:MAG: hypothetical protein KH373_01665 [Ruminococcus sp.]|nr:hypothetical protein [Ruminococcus sp.]
MAKKKSIKHKRINKSNSNTSIKYNKDVYTEEYKREKEYQETQKPLLLRIFVIAVACVLLLSFIILPILY